MNRFYFVIKNVLFDFFYSLQGFLVFLGRKKEVAINGDEMYVGRYGFNDFFQAITLSSDVNRGQKVIHGFVGLQ